MAVFEGDETMNFTYYTADVFTDRRFCGNQLAVFPNAAGLSSEEMQAIACEFNFSETVFVFEPENSKNTKRLRIFTPKAEVPFAGHPTIGSACVLAAAGEIAVNGQTAIVFEEGVGEVTVTVNIKDGELYAELRTAKAPDFWPCEASLQDIADVLSLSAGDIAVAEYPLMAASCGLPFLFVHIKSLQAMQEVRINQLKWASALQHEWEQQLYLFTTETINDDCNFHARMFASDLGFGEDPATGSAAAAFAGYLWRLPSIPEGQLKVKVEQGLEMGRPSKLSICAEKNNCAATNIRVGGHTVLVAKGLLTV
jgi:trans-2,3-dihydro-3-hydroxyanthranilate isomerase